MVRLLRVVGMLGILVSMPLRAGLQPRDEASAPPTEYQVKAAFLYHFAKYVQWPDEAFWGPQEPFVVGVLGEDPFGRVLEETLDGKTVLDRPIAIRRLGNVEEALAAHILFVSSSEERDLPRILGSLRGRAVLSAGETNGFAESGGIVGFKLKSKRVRFEINLSRAEEARLRISSQLLKLATIVSPRS